MHGEHRHSVVHFVGKSVELGVWIGIGFGFAVAFVYLFSRLS